MRPRLYIAIYTDEHITPKLAKALRAEGFESQSFLEAGMDGKPDLEHFQYAVQNGFALMTNNTADFKPMAENWVAGGRLHYGVILLPRQVNISELLRRCLVLLDSLTADDASNRILYLSNFG